MTAKQDLQYCIFNMHTTSYCHPVLQCVVGCDNNRQRFVHGQIACCSALHIFPAALCNYLGSE